MPKACGIFAYSISNSEHHGYGSYSTYRTAVMHVGGPQGDKRKKKKRLNAKHIVARSNGFWSHANYILPNSDARIFREKKKKKGS